MNGDLEKEPVHPNAFCPLCGNPSLKNVHEDHWRCDTCETEFLISCRGGLADALMEAIEP